MIFERIHLATLYTIAAAILPVLVWVDSRFAHAEDVQRSNTQIMLEVQQNSLYTKKIETEIKLQFYENKMKEGYKLKNYQEKDFDNLQDQQMYLIDRQSELDKLRQEIK